MRPYKLNSPLSDLKKLPPFDPAAGYQIVEGNPEAYIRFDAGGPSTRHRQGLWRCTPGAFACIEKGDELQTVLEGKLILIHEDGSSQEFTAGDSFYTEKGEKVTWKIIDTVTKVFFTHDTDGDGN